MCKSQQCAQFLGVLIAFFIMSGATLMWENCNPKLAKECQNYIPVHGTAVTHELLNLSCPICTNYQGGQCFDTKVVRCYSSYTEIQYNSGKSVCSVQSADKMFNPDAALDAAEQYHIGQKYYFVAPKRNMDVCLDPYSSAAGWTSGLFSLLLGIFGLISVCCYSCYKDSRTANARRTSPEVIRGGEGQGQRVTTIASPIPSAAAAAFPPPPRPVIPVIKGSGGSRGSAQQAAIAVPVTGLNTRNIGPRAPTTAIPSATVSVYHPVHVMNAELVCEDIEDSVDNRGVCDEV